MHVAICIITYQRPKGLTRLLDGLNQLRFTHDQPEIEVVVVDNDPAGTAADLCESRRTDFRWPLKYRVEPRRGIPAARNTSIAHIDDGADFVAFIDDDEVPEPDWLDELLRAHRAYKADAVMGAVIPHFATEVPAWIRKGEFLQYTRWPTGHRLNYGSTSSALVRADLLRDKQAPFDERMALSGGDDSRLFKRLHRAGCVIVYSNDAIVHESIPASRANAKWILRRAFRFGTTAAVVQRDSHSAPAATAVLLVLGCFRIFKGLFFFPFLAPFGKHLCVTYLRHICYGAGMLAGITGFEYQEYRTVHGA